MLKENRSTFIKVRVTEREKSDLMRTAKRKNVKVSSLMRSVLEDFCKK